MHFAASQGKAHWRLPFQDIAGSLFVLLLPFSTFWPLSESVAPEIIPIYGSYGVYLTDLPVFLLLITGALNAFQHRNEPRLKVQPPVKLVVIALILIPVLGLVTAPWAFNPQLAFYTVIRWALALGVFAAWQNKAFNLDRLTKIFLIGLAVQAVIGILQVVLKRPLGLPGEMALSIDRPRAAVLWLDGSAWLRAYGLTFHPNVLGGFLTVGLVLGLPRVNTWWGRICWWLMAAGLVATFSRSAWLAGALVLVPLAVWLYWQKPELRRPLRITLGVILAIGLASLVVLYQPIINRLDIFSSRSELASLFSRSELMKLAIFTLQHQPLSGIGAGNFPVLVINANLLDSPHAVHNVALLLGAEIGIAGGILWYVLLLTPVLTLGKGPYAIDLRILALAAAWLTFGLISFWDSYPWSLEAGRLLCMTLLAWIFRAKASYIDLDQKT